jgi:hypothetical protein
MNCTITGVYEYEHKSQEEKPSVESVQYRTTCAMTINRKALVIQFKQSTTACQTAKVHQSGAKERNKVHGVWYTQKHHAGFGVLCGSGDGIG